MIRHVIRPAAAAAVAGITALSWQVATDATLRVRVYRCDAIPTAWRSRDREHGWLRCLAGWLPMFAAGRLQYSITHTFAMQMPLYLFSYIPLR